MVLEIQIPVALEESRAQRIVISHRHWFHDVSSCDNSSSWTFRTCALFVYVCASHSVCPTLCNPFDCILPGSSVPGILQAWILEWFAIPFSRGSSQPRDWTHVSYTAGRSYTIWVTREAYSACILYFWKSYRTSLVVQWLRICHVGNMGSIPGQGTKIPQAKRQLSPWDTTNGTHTAQLERSLQATTKIPHAATKTRHSYNLKI